MGRTSIITIWATTITNMLNETYSFILAIVAAAAAGTVGAFALMKRLALAGDVISHIALPGIGLAILYGVNPLLGGAATLMLGIVIIWKLENKTGLSTEVTVGVIFAASLAIGALVTPEEELVEALFGGFGNLSFMEFVAGVVLGVAVVFSLWKMRDKLIVNLFSSELAAVSGVNLRALNLYFLIVFGLAVILGVRFLGALLMGSLIIIPAAAARQFTHTLGSFILVSSAISIFSVVSGLIISGAYGFNLGPAVVIIAAAVFALSLLKSGE